MASELKPCPLCSADPSSKFTDIKAAIWCEPCGLHMEYSTAMVSLRIAEEHQRSILTKRWNTRPAPVAPVSPQGILISNRFYEHLIALTGYCITRPPTPDHEFVNVCNGDLRKLSDFMDTVAPVSPDEVKPFRMSDGVMPIIVMARTREEAVKILNNRVNPSTEPEPETTSVSPDATGKCGELVTVQFECNEGEGWWNCGKSRHDFEKIHGTPTRELVTRSQAVELLAAKDAEIKACHENINLKSDFIEKTVGQLHEAEADNAALTARVNVLETEVAEATRRGEDQWAGWVKEEALRKALEADNAAKDARVKELEEDRDHQSKLSNKLNRSHAALEAQLERFRSDRAYTVGFTDGHAAAEAKLAAAHKALEAIEDHATRCFSLSTHSTTALAYLKDIQDEARAALGGKPS